MSDSIAGIAVLTQDAESAAALMADDPCVRAGMVTCDVLPCLGFPGDSLP